MNNQAYQPAFSRAAQTFVWAFFLLIVMPTMTIANAKFGIRVKPAIVYVVIAFGLAATAIFYRADVSFRGARAFFLAFAVLVAIIGATYRGEAIGGDYGGLLLRDGIPSNISYAVWPALNLVAACSIFVLARRFHRTIVTAAFVALILQVATMEADMWWFDLLSNAQGRAGGIAQNANVAALLVAVLASLTLPTRLGERFNGYAPYAMSLMIAAVLFSQSRAGVICAVICVLCSALAAWKGAARWPSPVFTVALLTVVGGTLLLSPVLNASSAEGGEAVSQFEARALNAAQSTALRREALIFFGDILKQNPQGIGTGFTNKFQTGPHNTFLKLAVDNSIIAAIGFAVMLAAATWQAVRMLSPALLSICLAAWAASMFYHTLLVEPLFPAALAIGLGSWRRP